MKLPTYIDALNIVSPETIFTAAGNGTTYESLTWVSGAALPSKEALDAAILSKTKELKWLEIQAERDKRKASGTPLNGYWFHSDDASRIQQLGLVMMGADLPTGIMWKTMSGAFIEMTPALASQIFTATATRDVQIFAVAEQHKAQMYASSDPASYDFLTSAPAWPTAYGDTP